MVTVAPPVEQMVTHYEFATGRAVPLDQVDVRARVNGYLKTILFQPGREVEKGQPLFEIDPEPYKADLALAKGEQASAEAGLANAEADLSRAEAEFTVAKQQYDRVDALRKSGAVSEQELDTRKGRFDEKTAEVRSDKAKILLAKAKIDEGKARVRTAELNLGYCTLDAPVAGVVGDRLVTEGNLVTGGVGTTTLTTVVSVEKMDVAFDVDENTLERLQKAVRDGKIKTSAPGEIPAEAGLAIHGTAYPIKGKINFTDNKVDPKTGTIRIKARFDNPKPAAGPRLFAPGMYARIRVPIGEPVKAMLVPDSAFGSDQGMRFLFVLGPDNKAVRLDATTGPLEGELRVVDSVQVPGEGKPRALSPDDRVIVSGIQRVRPGMTVDPKPAKK
jgi:RND family efflux transporter MFP subunit